jgi:nucleoid-associated protein YgaU
LQTASDRALADERIRYARAVNEEMERCAQEKQALIEERDRYAGDLEECKSKPRPAEVAVAVPVVPSAEYHQVKRGDCLWRIAEAIYGDPFQWPLIFWANRDKVSNPDRIYPKQELKIPREVSRDEVNRAVKEASERPRPKVKR